MRAIAEGMKAEIEDVTAEPIEPEIDQIDLDQDDE
jgi:hypothetical protein